jgi:hypothetical protein
MYWAFKGRISCTQNKNSVRTSQETHYDSATKRVDNITMYLRETGWGCMDWIDLDQNRDQWMALVNTAMNPRIL